MNRGKGTARRLGFQLPLVTARAPAERLVRRGSAGDRVRPCSWTKAAIPINKDDGFREGLRPTYELLQAKLLELLTWKLAPKRFFTPRPVHVRYDRSMSVMRSETDSRQVQRRFRV